MTRPCTPMTVHVGAEECLDGECGAYLNKADEPLDLDSCPHLDTEELCETHSTVDGNRVVHREPWPCQADIHHLLHTAATT